MTEILKESEDRYQTGEDEIAETFDSADEAAASFLRSMTVRVDRDVSKGELVSRKELVRWMLQGGDPDDDVVKVLATTDIPPATKRRMKH